MMRRKYRTTAIVISICFLLSSCLELDTYRYYGNNISLAVASRESILGVYGHYQDKTIILEIDDQGRILYGFLGTAMWYGKYVIAIGIVQEVSDNYVFYYDGYNVLTQTYSGSTSDLLNKELIYSFFDDNSIVQLKSDNDWAKAIDSSRYFKTEIRDKKQSPLKNSELSKVYNNFNADLNRANCLLLSIDKNGKMLYLMIEYIYKEIRYGVAYIIMFDETGNVVPTTGILEIKLSNSNDYRGVLREFKSVNGWAFY